MTPTNRKELIEARATLSRFSEAQLRELADYLCLPDWQVTAVIRRIFSGNQFKD